MTQEIDLNSDLGEGYGIWSLGNDEQMLQVVSSANVACGFHAGDPKTIIQTLGFVQQNDVTLGAHVSYPDLVGFGRRAMQLEVEELTASVIYQIGALQALAKTRGLAVEYVKPHGALYHAMARDESQAEAVVAAIKAVDPELPIVALAGSSFISYATDAGLQVVAEAFADRHYQADGQLVPRSEPGATLQDPLEISRRIQQLAQYGTIQTVAGTSLEIQAQTVCVHSDPGNAVDVAIQTRQELEKLGVTIRPFLQ